MAHERTRGHDPAAHDARDARVKGDRVRLTILLGSSVSGLVLGLFLGLGALALLAFISTMIPAASRWAERLRAPALVVMLVLLPLAGALLGYLEGRAKLR